ncbi:MAG: hypothetical protein LUQ33_01680, partial [Methanoregulaceae archaeon]|nr:hypothetical protein [Methanoregulaceae archaeon]
MRNGKFTGLLVALLLTLITFSIPVMGSVEPASAEFNLSPGASTTEYKNVTIPEYPEMADVLFSVDLSSSMQSKLFLLNYDGYEQMPEFMTGLGPTGADIHYGLSSHSDYPGYYTWPCGYSANYGSSTDFAYVLNQPITDAESAVIMAFDGLIVGDGWDNAESYSRVFYESYSDPETGWRTGSKRVMIHIGDDSVPHDCNLNEGIPGKFDVWTMGGDPGSDGIAGTADDLDFQTVLSGMEENNIILIRCQETFDNSEYWNVWTAQTGGKFLVYDWRTFGDSVSSAV